MSAVKDIAAGKNKFCSPSESVTSCPCSHCELKAEALPAGNWLVTGVVVEETRRVFVERGINDGVWLANGGHEGGSHSALRKPRWLSMIGPFCVDS